MSISDIKQKIQSKLKNSTFFSSRFGFESGIDIANDNEVLYRKNVVIKNIIVLVNLVYTIIFTIISIDEPSNWLLTVLLFPITYIVNHALGKMIKKGPDDHNSQVIAMYASCFYMFLSAVILYIKLKYGEATYLKEAGYILLYVSLAVCAYYQDKKMLKNISIWVVVLVTILHFTVTYSIVSSDEAKNVFVFLQSFFKSTEFRDIFIRTILLILFIVILYINVMMTNYMQDERKKELIKRRQVQEDFTNVVTDIFNVTLNSKDLSLDEIHNIEILALMSKKLASFLSLTPDKCDEIYKFTRLQVDHKIHLGDKEFSTDDEKFEALREETARGSHLISRLQLERKCDDIIRAVFEGSNNDEFVQRMREIQNNTESQIILICNLYVSMRSVTAYKKAYNHQNTMKYMEEQFKIYFDPVIFERFVRFDSDFKKIYEEDEEEE